MHKEQTVYIVNLCKDSFCSDVEMYGIYDTKTVADRVSYILHETRWRLNRVNTDDVEYVGFAEYTPFSDCFIEEHVVQTNHFLAQFDLDRLDEYLEEYEEE